MFIGGGLADYEPTYVVRAPLSATYMDSPLQPHTLPSSKLPRLHWCAYKGDVEGVLQGITDGCSLHETVSLRNQHGRLVCGITALFLAAQRGHGEIVKLLVTNGASPVQPCYIQGSTELCTPSEVASLNLHFKLSRWLKSAARARRKEDEVLALDDEDRMSQVSSRLARGLDRARSTRSVGLAGTQPGGGSTSGALVRISRGSRTGGGVAGGGATGAGPGLDGGMQPVVPPTRTQLEYGSHGGEGGLGPEGAENDPQRIAALNFMQNVDLAAFDPDAGDAPPFVTGPGGGKAAKGPVARLFRRLMSWGGSQPHGGAAHGGGGGGGSILQQEPAAAVRASASQRVRGSGGGAAAGTGVARNLAMDLEAVDPTRPDHTKVLQRFLKDLDLAHWRPEQDGPLDRSTLGNAPSTRPASPGRSRASPPRSVRSNVSPARSRA